MDDRFRSRKFLLTAAVFVVGSIALFTGHLDGAQWSATAIVCIGAYNWANAQVAQ